MRSDAHRYYEAKLLRLPDAGVRAFERPHPGLHNVESVHIVGVCGTAMASLAGLLVAAGYRVSGSDDGFYPPMSTVIEELGIEVFDGFEPRNLDGRGAVVIGNAIHPDNPEAVYAREQGLLQLSVAEALQAFFLDGRRSLVVAGTHGKTTTAGLLAHVLTAAGRAPSYLVGGAPQGSGPSYRLGRGPDFVLEGDEYDTAYFDKAPKFLHYRPYHAILTSVELDHVDIFHDVEEYHRAFRFFAAELPAEGSLFAFGDDPTVAEIARALSARSTLYGLGDQNDLRAENRRQGLEGQSFTLVSDGQALGELRVPLPGEHNLLNTLAVCGLSLELGLELEELRQALASFPGMRRRQEVRGEADGVTVIDDFAHHPTAVRETVRAIRSKYPERRLVAVFQPRSNTSRRKLFEDEYGAAFTDADVAVLAASPFLRSDSEGNRLDAERVVRLIQEHGTEAAYGGEVDSLLATLLRDLQPGDVALIMSNGAFGNLHQRLLDALAER